MADFASLLSAQWTNPSDVSTVLMVIGGEIVRTALAQSTGTAFTPVCFSFGWVSYAFSALVAILGEGRLMPPPDYPVKVFNLNSGYSRENKNWVLGRIVRDYEAWISKRDHGQFGIRVSIFEAQPNPNCWTRFSYDWIHLVGLVFMVVQLLIAAVPAITSDDWIILLITGAGTILALMYGALPQWTTEKLPNRQHSHQVYGLTTGNGSRDIMVIKGLRNCLNLEDFAATDSPRNKRAWEKFLKFSEEGGVRPMSRSFYHRVVNYSARICGIPIGFWMTMIATVIHSILWLLLLICVAAVKQNTWYLLLIGFIGMFQNGIIAAVARPSEARNLPLKFKREESITRWKVMDGLMDLEVRHKCGRPFLKEFFPDELQKDEKLWWNEGKREPYDDVRAQQQSLRGLPASMVINENRDSFEKNDPRCSNPTSLARPIKSALKARSTNQSVSFADASRVDLEDSPGPFKSDLEPALQNLTPISSGSWRISPRWE